MSIPVSNLAGYLQLLTDTGTSIITIVPSPGAVIYHSIIISFFIQLIVQTGDSEKLLRNQEGYITFGRKYLDVLEHIKIFLRHCQYINNLELKI